LKWNLKETKKFESKINDSKRELCELHKQVSEMHQQMVMMQDEFQTKGQNTQWADIVSQAVDTKFEMVSAGINMVEKSIE